MLADITAVRMEDWYAVAQDRGGWTANCHLHAADSGNGGRGADVGSSMMRWPQAMSLTSTS